MVNVTNPLWTHGGVEGFGMALFSRKKKAPVRGGDDGGRYEPPAQSYAPRVGDLTVGDYANGMPNIRLAEMFKSFGRQLTWLIPLFLIGLAAAWYFTKDFKRTYTGDGRVMVQLGDEYVYQPVSGQGGQGGLMLTADTIALNEVGIIKNSEIIEQVFGEMTSSPQDQKRFDRAGFAKYNAARTEADRIAAKTEMMLTMDKSFVVMPRPKSSIIDLVYKHEDGDIAVRTLNAFIDAYMSYRRTIFVEGAGDIISERRAATEQQLAQNERAIARFLQKNNVSDFGSEQKGVQKRTEELRAALNLLRAQMSETERALATVENQLRATPETIDLYREDRASARIAQAELELKQLLAKYLPTSDPVKQKQTELAELKSLQTSYGGKAAGGRRVGPNTVYQALLTRRNTLQATADSYREKEYTLQQQLNSADGKVRRLTSLSPAYQNLLRERDTLSDRLKVYNTKEQEALVNQSQAEANNENIKVISYAKYPNKGRNMRLIMFALAGLGWGFTLFMLALLRVFLDPKLYASPAARYQTAATAVPRGAQIPEPVAPDYTPEPQAPYQEPAVASYEPQAYQPSGHHGGGGGYAAQGQDYNNGYSMPAAEPYMAGTTAHYDQGYVDPNGYTQGYTDPNTYAQGSAALDMYQNPYLSGQVSAGSLEQAAEQAPQFGPPPTDPPTTQS